MSAIKSELKFPREQSETQMKSSEGAEWTQFPFVNWDWNGNGAPPKCHYFWNRRGGRNSSNSPLHCFPEKPRPPLDLFFIHPQSHSKVLHENESKTSNAQREITEKCVTDAGDGSVNTHTHTHAQLLQGEMGGGGWQMGVLGGGWRLALSTWRRTLAKAIF